MDVIQLLNPISPLETPLRLRHTIAKKGDQQQIPRFIHISGYNVPLPAARENSNRSLEDRQRRRLAGRRLRDSKRILREDLARAQQQIERLQRVNSHYEEEIKCLRQRLESSMKNADIKSDPTGWHDKNSLSALPLYTAPRDTL